MPAGDVFGLDGFFLNVSNPVTVSSAEINQTTSGAGITVVSGTLNATTGIATLTFDPAAGLSTTPFYTGAKIAVSGLGNTLGVAYTGYNGVFVVTGYADTTTVSYTTTGYVGSVSPGITTTGLVMLVTDTAVTNTTWSSAQTHGLFGGGRNSSGTQVSIVDRIDFSNDTGTASVRGPLSSAKYSLAATGNSNYGWFGGGAFPSVSTIERIDFSNDFGTTSVRGPLSRNRRWHSVTGNSNYGWFGGGYSFPTSVSTLTADRIDFSNDSSTASPRGPLNSTRNYLSATGNSNYGWFGGGSGPVATVDRIDFSNDSATASPRGSLSLARHSLAATGNSNYGWFGGGFLPAPGAVVATVDRIDFSNDSATASPRGSLSLARRHVSATGNSNYGWFGGGTATPSPFIVFMTVDRIDFSNDSVTASVRGPLSSTRYFMGGATSGQAKSSSTRLQKAGSYGWFGGGGPSAAAVATVNRIDFSNDLATASTRGPLSQARYHLAATGNSNYGWFGGGVPGPVATVDRINFSNDSVTASIRGPLSLAKYDLAATGNSNYGWFGGGYSPGLGALLTVDRIDFSNDSSTASPRGPLSSARYYLAATGNSNYGWFGGGNAPAIPTTFFSRVDRINFSNDSVASSIRGPLSVKRGYYLAATGNSNYGWFGGGADPTIPSPYFATVDRINFSNDSISASVRGPLSLARADLAATGNSNYGWFGGGNTPTITATVDRIDFSNDSASALARGPLSAVRYGLAATSNTTR